MSLSKCGIVPIWSLWFLALWASIPWTSARAEDQSDLLSTVSAGHRSARESIRSLSADVAKDSTDRNSLVTGRYWRSLNRVRVQEDRPRGWTEHYLIQDSEIRQVARGPAGNSREVQYVVSRKPSTDMFCLCDVWLMMLIEFPGPSEGACDFDRYLEFAIRSPKLKREKIDGHACIRLEMSLDTSAGRRNVTLWHDVNCNYLVRKMITHYDKWSERTEAEVLEFLESPAGVFIPVRCRRRVYRNGELGVEQVTSISNVHVNEAIPASVFLLPAIPRGTLMKDRVQGTEYRVDENWQAITASSPLKTLKLPGPAPGQNIEYRSPSTEEPGSLLRWLAPASLAILAVAISCWLYRRYRSRPA